MKTVTQSLFCFLFLSVVSLPNHAVEWPTTPVVGVIGASFADCDAPLDSPLLGVGYIGCSYEALAPKLLKHHTLDKLGITVQSVALGGAVSYDVPGTGWKGFVSQYNHLVARTSWLDGVPRLKYLLISIPNDCLHTTPCTEQDMTDVLIANVKQVVASATQAGTTVFINGYPKWEDLDLNTVAVIFGLSNIISESDYLTLRSLHEQELSGLTGVHYLKPWEEQFVTIDGLHPDDDSVLHAADVIAREIKELEKR
jgi:hypothetical protein